MGKDIARASLWLDQAVGHHVEGDLNAADALTLTAKIKAYVGVTWILLSEAHEHRADKALGYDSWADYVKAEFDMSRGHAYRLVAHAQAVYELAEVAGMGGDVSPMGDIPERATRDADLEAVAAEVEAQTAALPAEATPEERADVVRTALSNHPKAEPPSGDPTPQPAAGGDAPQVDSPAAPPPADPKQPRTREAAVNADLNAHRVAVAKWLAFPEHDEAIESMSAQERTDYRSFVHSVWTHANQTLDALDNPARLKAVQ